MQNERNYQNERNSQLPDDVAAPSHLSSFHTDIPVLLLPAVASEGAFDRNYLNLESVGRVALAIAVDSG